MCFDVKLTKTIYSEEAKIADKDIVVFKYLRRSGKILRSPFRKNYGNTWKTGVPHKAKLVKTITNSNNIGHINIGLHSYVMFNELDSYSNYYRAIIPKGAYYYKNDREYVSSVLMITSNTPYRKRKNNGKRKQKARAAVV